MEILRGAVERDKVNFELMEALPRSTGYYTVRLRPAWYERRYFEGPVPEGEAIRRVRAFATETGFRCSIGYPRLLTIYIEPDGSIIKKYYRPGVKVTDNWVAFERAASRVGTTG
jgi:hypothetical protein